MNRMETVPRALNLVKKVADLRLTRGKRNKIRNSGTVVNWPHTSSILLGSTTPQNIINQLTNRRDKAIKTL
jgi:hypothetical protein